MKTRRKNDIDIYNRKVSLSLAKENRKEAGAAAIYLKSVLVWCDCWIICFEKLQTQTIPM